MTDDVTRGAVLSADGRYRYSLARGWADEGQVLGFVMLNPSTADAELDDPTILRCMKFARREGCRGIVVFNLFSYRTSHPAVLKTVGLEEAVGPGNREHIADWLRLFGATGFKAVVCAWGNFAQGLYRLPIESMLADAHVPTRCLGKTKLGAPKHPLARGKERVPDDAPLRPWGPWGRDR